MYLTDFLYGATRRPCGWLKPWVVKGYFAEGEIGSLQKKLYIHLLGSGFKRTPWQIVFPGQVAGVIKRVQAREFGANQYHIRFYYDGVIESELEHHNWSSQHWSGYRKLCWAHLDQLLEEAPFTPAEKVLLREFFQTKNYCRVWLT